MVSKLTTKKSKEYTDDTFATIEEITSHDITLDSHSTSIIDHGTRLTAIEGANYATTLELSLYATASSLGNTNDTVGGINTRVNSLENAGYITTPALQAYSYATTGQLADYALSTSVPTTTDILNNTNMGATATSGATAGVSVTNKSSGTGVDFNFTIPPGAQGEQGTQGDRGDRVSLVLLVRVVSTRTVCFRLTKTELLRTFNLRRVVNTPSSISTRERTLEATKASS